jgi:hypothetical protein
LTPAAAARWSGLSVPAWVAKGALTAGWAAAFVAAAVGDTTTCTPDAPSLCGPDQGFAWWVVICLATPVLLVWLPLLGCVAGVAFALADQVFDHVTSARFGFGLHGLACAVVALWLLRSATAQQRIASDAGHGVRAAVPTGHGRPDTDWDLVRVVAAAVFALLGIGLLGWYSHVLQVERGHLAAAEQVTGRVVAVDDEDSSITVEASTTAGPRRVTLGVLDTRTYPQGDTTPVLLDVRDPTWARLVAEPQDATGWESAGLLALLLAVLVIARGLRARRARERLWTGEYPALRVWVVPDEAGNAVVFADSGARPDVVTASPVARLPLAWAPEEDDDSQNEVPNAMVVVSGHPLQPAGYAGEADDDEWALGTQAAFGRAWRGEEQPDDIQPLHPSGPEPEPAVLLGSLRDRGWALLLTQDDVLQPSGPLRLHRGSPGSASDARPRLPSRLPFGPWRTHAGDERQAGEGDDAFLPGAPVRQAQAGPIELPMVAAGPVRTRTVGVCMLVAALAGVPALLLLAGLGWYERGLAVLVGGRVLLGGTARLVEQVRLSHTHLQVVGSYRVHSVPWERLHGVRRDGARLAIAWQPDVVADVGPFHADGTEASDEARAERLGAVMLTLRRRAFVDMAAGRPARSRPGPAWAVLAGYATLVGLALWGIAAV